MDKAQLIMQISEDAGITQKQANQVLNSFTRCVADTLASGDAVTLVGFGTFSVLQRASRAGRNPQTGEAIEIKAKQTAKFKPGTKFKDNIGGVKVKAKK